MATRQGIIDRLRLEMADFTYAFQATFEGDGVTTRLDLPHDNIATGSPFSIYLLSDPGNPYATPADYILDARSGWVVLTNPAPAGDTIVVDGYYSELFSDDQLGSFVDTSFTLHSHNTNHTYSSLPSAEEYLIVLAAKVEAIWVMATDAAYDIDVRTVEGVSVPRSQRFAQLMALINGLKNQYNELAAALNAGPNRIEVMDLRRVSRTTGRYVPVYIDREFDDNNPPIRVFPRQDKRDDVDIPRDAAEFNLVIDKDQPFAKDFTFKDSAGAVINLTGYEFRGQIRPDTFDLKTVLLSFTVTETDLVNGVITLELTEEEVDKLEVNHPYGWDFQWKPTGGEWDTQLRGKIIPVLEESR